MTARVNSVFDIFQGNRKSLEFTIEENSGGTLSAKNLTDLRLTWALARGDTSQYSATAILFKDSDEAGEFTIVDLAGGIARVELYTADTSTLSPATYYWELELHDTSGNSEVVARGTMRVLLNVKAA